MGLRTNQPVERLLTVLSDPHAWSTLAVGEQELVLRLARRVGLLASLRARLEQAGVLATLSPRMQDFLEGGWIIALEHKRSMRWEVNRIQRAFYNTGLPVILLKGAAYELLDLPFAKGRLAADVDLLLPREDLPLAEQRLLEQGWVTTQQDPYDQHYYRAWMHELPPMRHRQRMTELDLHHAILPPSARLHPDSAQLLADAQPVEGFSGVWTLSGVDMILHGVAHLFYDSDFSQGGLRGLLDLDALLRQHGQDPDFFGRLIDRAVTLELLRPLYYALYFTARLCGTPMPLTALVAAGRGGPGWVVMGLMKWLIPWAILPAHPDGQEDGWRAGVARWLLYVRSHWLRMPPHLLIPHLARKWVKKW